MLVGGKIFLGDNIYQNSNGNQNMCQVCLILKTMKVSYSVIRTTLSVVSNSAKNICLLLWVVYLTILALHHQYLIHFKLQ